MLSVTNQYSIGTICILLFTISNAFNFNQEVINPSLTKYSFNQEGKTLNLNLDISNPQALPTIPQNNNRLYVQNLELQLGTKPPTNPISLPGANGPNPQLSSGPFLLDTIVPGSFISMGGKQTLSITNAAWEMIWKEYNVAGSLICALDLNKDVQRNSAILKKGLLYMHFPVWTQSGLEMARREKIDYQQDMASLVKQQNTNMERMRNTKNPLEKAMCLRNAVAANEKMSVKETDRFDSIPKDGDVIALGDGLVICTKGTIWRKGIERDLFGRVEHFLLGVASIENKSFEVEE